MSPSDKSIGLFEKITMVVLICCSILQTYGYGKFDYTFFVTSVLAILNLLFRKRTHDLPIYISFYLCYWAIVHIASSSSIASALPVGIIKTFLVYLLFFENVQLKFLLKAYMLIGTLCIVFFWIQEFMFVTTGSRIPGVVTFLPLALQIEDTSSYMDKLTLGVRSASFFSEPAHLAQFILPLLALTLFKKGGRYNYVYSFVITFSLLYLRSGNGFWGLGAVYLAFISYQVFVKTNPIKKVGLLVFLLIFGYVGALKYMESDMGDYILQRQDQLSMEATSGKSGFIRIYRGFFVYDAMPLFEKIIGNDNPDEIKHYINTSSVSSFFWKKDDMYFNTIQSVLIRTGIIGLVIFIFMLCFFWRKTNYSGKAILFCFITLSFISAHHFSEIMCLYLLIPYIMGKQNAIEYA